MKFLCDQCKAKYQISDDKVVGKTVRMKCRKCGHQIEVRAAVTETSVSGGMPKEDAPFGHPAGTAHRSPSVIPGASVGGAKPPAPPRVGLATSLSATRPTPPKPATRTDPPPAGALAGAFRSSVQKDDDAAAAVELLELSSAEEWYCAINGVPVGPVRIAELRRKAAVGAVTGDSLVWQEGLEEWRTVRSIPELAAIVREASTSGRPPLATPYPPEVDRPRASVPPPGGSAGIRPAPMRPSAPPRAPEPPRQAAGRSNVVPITSRLTSAATAERLDDAPHAAPFDISVAADPFASLPVSPPATQQSAAFSPSMAAPAAALAPPIFTTAPPEAKKPPSWILIGMFVLFATFGVTLAFVVGPSLIRPPPAPVAPPPVVVQVPVPVQPTVSAEPPPAPSDLASAPQSPTGKGTASATGQTRTGTAKPQASGKAVDPSIAALLQGTGSGPSTGGGSSGSGGSGGGTLTQDQVEAVVRNHSLGVRRSCWERGASSSPNANISVSITVGGNGQVSSATATGDDTAVAKCIETSVRSWQFPATGSTSTIKIPFHFVRQ